MIAMPAEARAAVADAAAEVAQQPTTSTQDERDDPQQRSPPGCRGAATASAGAPAGGPPRPAVEQRVRVGPHGLPSPPVARSGARMRPCVDLPDALARQVRVQLRGGDAGMAQQLLDHAQVRAALEQVRGETMPQRVRRHTRRQPGTLGAARWMARHASMRPSRRPRADRNSGPPRRSRSRATRRRSARPSASQAGRTVVEVALEAVEGDVADRHQPLAVALADDPHEAAVERQVLPVEPERLADAQAGRVQQLQQRPVADARGLVRRRSPRAAPPPRPRRASPAARRRLPRQVEQARDVDVR